MKKFQLLGISLALLVGLSSFLAKKQPTNFYGFFKEPGSSVCHPGDTEDPCILYGVGPVCTDDLTGYPLFSSESACGANATMYYLKRAY